MLIVYPLRILFMFCFKNNNAVEIIGTLKLSYSILFLLFNYN